MFLDRFHIIYIILFQIILALNLWAGDVIQYLSPRPEAKYVSVQTSLTIRFDNKWKNTLDLSILDISVQGEKSGPHEGKFDLLDDGITFIFKPLKQFLPNEIVHIEVSTDLPSFNEAINYDFRTSNKPESMLLVLEEEADQDHEKNSQSQMDTYGQASVINSVSIPSDFPKFNIDIQEETAEGMIFMTNTDGSPYLMILENDGTPYFYQRLPGSSNDFKVQPTGTLTRLGWPRIYGFFEMDSNYKIIDTLDCGNGYRIDAHDIQLLPNGNYLVIALDEQLVDMSQIVEGGRSNATVIGNHIQELDRNGNVMFEWRSWDHYDIIDATHEDLTLNTIDYCHMNAIAVDYDGNLLVSARTLSEITKINRETGEIIWRLGGENNQFDFVNDEDSISYQHDIRPVPGKENYYTLFDNGRYHLPRYSRAVEFLIDTTNMTATKVWEYRSTPDRYTDTRGSVQRLPNGNTFIDWSGGPVPIATEVTPEGLTVYEISFIENMRTYRSFRFDWEGILQVPYLIAESWPDKVSLIFNKFGDADITGYIIYGGKEYEPEIVIDTTSNTWIDLTNLDNYTQYHFRVTAIDTNGVESGFSNEEEVFVKFINPGENLILNGTFSDSTEYWELETSGNASAQGIAEDSIYHIQIDSNGVFYSDVQLSQNNLEIIEGGNYVFEFDAWSSKPKYFEVKIQKAIEPWTDYSRIGAAYSTPDKKHYKYEFTMNDPTDYSARIVFNCGQSVVDLFIDYVSLTFKEIETNIESSPNYPVNYKLFANYPNPFNPVTIIKYQLPMPNDVDLSIYNVLGQKVVTLVSKKQEAGHYQVDWDARGFASGIYYYRIEARSLGGRLLYNEAKKMIVIK